MQKENLFFVYTLFILFFVSASLCSIADPVNSYVIKQGSGYLIVARNIFGENITTGGDEFFAIAAGEPFVQYASSAEASDYYKGYPPSEATGEPNVEICGDSRNAWSQYSPGRYDWLELKYNTTVFPLSVFLYETADSAPCVQNISTAGYSQNIFLENFIDTSSCPTGKLTEDFTPTRIDIGYHWLVNRVNLTVHCRGYAEIDSVALFGSPAIFLNVSDNEDGTYFVNTSSVAEEYLTLYVSLSFATVTGSPIKLATNEEGSSCSRAIYTSVPSTTEGNLLSAEIGNGCLSSSFPPSSGLWYSLIGTGKIIEVSTCGSVGPNTGISVYTGNCSLSSSLSCISYSFSNFSQKCNCQTNGRTGNALEFQSTLGVQYFIFVQQIEESVVGNFFLTIKDNITHIPPENDICISAKLMEIGETQKGTIQDSTADTINTCNGVIAETEGIWYTFAGTNKKIVFSTCNTEFPHTVTIFTGECGLLCPEENIFSNDNFCDSNYGASFTVPTYDGSVYYVLIKNTTCVSPHTEVEVKLDTIQYCPFGDLYFENYPLDPLSVQYSYCQWKSPSSTLGAQSTLTLDPNSLYFSNDSVIDFTLYSNCGDQIYQVTTLSATDVFTSVNGFIVEITNVAGVAFVNASITTQPFASNVRAPPLNSWGKFSADKLYCNMSKMYTSDKPFLTVTANNYLYAVQEYGSSETTFLVRMFNIETAELDYVVQLDTSASSELPSPNYGGYSFVNYNDKVYVFGGYTQTKNSGPSNYPTVVNGPDSFYELDPVSKLITKIPLTGVITGRSEASLSAYKNYIVVFGGMYYGQIRDTYPSIITIIDMDLTPILAKEPSIKGPHPVGRILHTSVVYGDCLYIFGGSFDRFTYFGDFWRFNISSLSWTLLGNYTGQSDFPAARTGHVAILYKDSMVMFGGGYKFVPFKDMWSYNFTTATWTSLPVGPNIEVPVIDYASAAVAGGVILAVAAIDNLEYTRFNAIPVFQYTIEDICLSYEADGCHACPAGTYVMDTFIQGVCFSCPVGSFSSVSSSPSCSLCPPAMYQDQESQESCFYCPAGFYGNASGSTSVNSCNPCSYGSFSALPGSTSCYSCPSGAFCPLGSIQPLSIKEFSDVVSSSEAAFQAEDTDRYKEIEYKFLWIIAGFIFLWILFVIVIIIMKCANAKSLYRRVQRVDVLNITKYNIPGPVLKTRSIMGGVVSALALFIILGLLVYVSVTYRYNNDMITAGLVAGLSRTTDVVTNHLNISVQLVGFSGQCETSIQGQCSPGITVSQTGFSKIGETKCTTIDSSTCIMSWSVNAGNKVQNPSDVTFQIFSEPASTYAMRWNVTADSVYDGRYTYVSGDTYPDSLSNVFRGLPTDPPSLIQLSIIPTTLTFWNKHDRNREGVTLNFLARGTGHQVNDSSFYEEGQVLGFSVKFEFEIPQFIYQKTVNQRETAFAMASMYIALVGGVFSVSRIALQIYFNCKHVTSRRSAKTVNTEDVEYESLLNVTEEEENISVS